MNDDQQSSGCFTNFLIAIVVILFLLAFTAFLVYVR